MHGLARLSVCTAFAKVSTYKHTSSTPRASCSSFSRLSPLMSERGRLLLLMSVRVVLLLANGRMLDGPVVLGG